ncbi:mitofusin [Allomyces arbusculus]|nr:mitofusin [Allomyces arbusculus]
MSSTFPRRSTLAGRPEMPPPPQPPSQTAASAVLSEMYTENQKRLVAYLQRARGLVSEVERLTQSSQHQRLLYPLDLARIHGGSRADHDGNHHRSNSRLARTISTRITPAVRVMIGGRKRSGTAAPPGSEIAPHAMQNRRVSAPHVSSASLTAARSEIGTAPTRQLSRASSSRSFHDDSDTGNDDGDEMETLFRVLTLDVPATSAGFLLPADALTSMLRNKLTEVRQHLVTLEGRVQDPTCRILVTGDLNSGKSSFVNALLRRNVVPVDQQPLTNVFVEVLDARHNTARGQREEVHLVRDGATILSSSQGGDDKSKSAVQPAAQQRHQKHKAEAHVDEADVYPLDQLAHLVAEPNGYEMIKCFISEDPAATSTSVLVGNESVDVHMIDSPGLNRDVWQTMALFSQEKEIDVIVFVVSAPDHFTLSSREFLTKAGQEKAYIFVVINKFDSIRDKERCKRTIMRQIQQLSPHTFEYRDKLVHFVSAEGMLRDVQAAQRAGAVAVSQTPRIAEFLHVERALKEFTLEKRAVSKQSPVKRYIEHLLHDMELLLDFNVAKLNEKLTELRDDLAAVQPREAELAERKLAVMRELNDMIARAADSSAAVVAAKIAKLPALLAERGEAVEWPGLLHAHEYVRSLHRALVDVVCMELEACRQHALTEMQTAWDAMANAHAEWALAAAAALGTPAAAAKSALIPLKVPATPLTQLYPLTMALTPASLLFPHSVVTSSADSSSTRTLQRIVAMIPTSRAAWRDSWHATATWVLSLTWSDVVGAPSAAISLMRTSLVSLVPSGTTSMASLALTGCSFITRSAMFPTRAVSSDLFSLGLRVGLRRMTLFAAAGAFVAAGAFGYHYVATMPAHLPHTLAEAVVNRMRAAQYPDTIAAHLRTTAAVALTHTLGDAAAKMDAGIGSIRDRRDALAAQVQAAEEAVDEMESVKERCVLLRGQVHAVAVDESLASVPVRA